jgi:hypothetical protein
MKKSCSKVAARNEKANHHNSTRRPAKYPINLPPPPLFEPDPSDEYIKPKINELVTVRYNEQGYQFRTGILCSHPNDGRIRFYEGGENANSEPVVVEYKWYMNRTTFKEGRFRSRPDLTVGATCYDRQSDTWCQLAGIDIPNGAVSVEKYQCSDGSRDQDPVRISPDQLVGINENYEEMLHYVSDSCAGDGLEEAESPVATTATGTGTAAPTPPRPGNYRQCRPTPPLFSVKKDDEYREPQCGDLVSYLWAKEPKIEYRVAVLSSDSKKGNLRFFNPSYVNNFHLCKEKFDSGHFRVRHDLAPGRYVARGL